MCASLSMPQTAAKHVVCVSWIPVLAETRELLLKEAGWRVTTILGAEQTNKLRNLSQADLLVLAHSVPRVEKQSVLELFRRKCKAPILSLLGPNQKKLPEADFAVEAMNPADFIRVVRQILSD